MSSGAYAAIFDLDGVLTSTSVRHEQSWAEAAARFGIPVTIQALGATRSVPRASALSALLAHAGMEMDPEAREKLMAFKNQRYHQLIEGLTPIDAFAGSHEALQLCRERGLRVGVASASLNAGVVLERIGLSPFVDFIADPRAAAAKPSAEIYRKACAALDVNPGRAICVEDGAPMIANLRAAGMYTVGVGLGPLGADEQFDAISEWDVDTSVMWLKLRA